LSSNRHGYTPCPSSQTRRGESVREIGGGRFRDRALYSNHSGRAFLPPLGYISPDSLSLLTSGPRLEQRALRRARLGVVPSLSRFPFSHQQYWPGSSSLISRRPLVVMVARVLLIAKSSISQALMGLASAHPWTDSAALCQAIQSGSRAVRAAANARDPLKRF